MNDRERRSALGDFLRKRRASLSPEDVGLPTGSRRRTAGLRREEVAQLSNIGTSWYMWLEQGRDVRPSVQVLESLAAALKLNPNERRHLFFLQESHFLLTCLLIKKVSGQHFKGCWMTLLRILHIFWEDAGILLPGMMLQMRFSLFPRQHRLMNSI